MRGSSNYSVTQSTKSNKLSVGLHWSVVYGITYSRLTFYTQLLRPISPTKPTTSGWPASRRVQRPFWAKMQRTWASSGTRWDCVPWIYFWPLFFNQRTPPSGGTGILPLIPGMCLSISERARLWWDLPTSQLQHLRLPQQSEARDV